MMWQRTARICVVALGLSLEPSAFSQTPAPRFEVQVGSQTITIPAPEGFERLDGVSAKQDELLAQFAGTNRQLIFFGSPDAVAAARRGEPSHSERNFNAQTLRSLEDQALTPEDFERLRDETEAEILRLGTQFDSLMGKSMANASQSLSERLKEDVEIRVGMPVPLGIFERTRDSLGFSMLLKTDLAVSGQQSSGLSIVACMVVRARDRWLYLYTTAPRTNDADEQWARAEVTKWRNAIFSANGQTDAPATAAAASSPAPFNAIFLGLGLGSAAAGAALLISLVVRRFRASPSDSL
ncbi:MAG: hypothetical protein ACOYMN_11085 [Roseimicrobium sp.]